MWGADGEGIGVGVTYVKGGSFLGFVSGELARCMELSGFFFNETPQSHRETDI